MRPRPIGSLLLLLGTALLFLEGCPGSNGPASPGPSGPTMSPTSSPTNSPTLFPTDTATSSPTSTPTSSPTLTATRTATSSPTLTASRTPTFSPTHTTTPLPTDTPTQTPTASPSRTPTSSPTLTPTATQGCGGSYQFGYNVAGPNPGSFNANMLFANSAVLSVPATLQSLQVYFASGGGNARTALYDDASGTPGNLIAESGSQAASGGSWNTFTVTSTYLPAGTYWLACQLQVLGPAVAYQPSEATFITRNYSFGPFPSSFSAGATNLNSFHFSMAANYCVGSGSPTPVNTPAFTATATFTSTFTPTHTETPSCLNPYHFGYDVQGGQSGTFNANSVHANMFVLSTPATVTSLSLYVSSFFGQAQAAIYDGTDTTLGNLVVQSNPQSVVSSGWANFQVPGTYLAAPATYWLCYNSAPSIQIPYEANVGTDSGFNYSFGSFPSTAPYSFATQNRQASLYASFCVGAGTPTPLPTGTFTATPTVTSTPTFTPTETPLCGSPSQFGVTNASGSSTSTFGSNQVETSPFTFPGGHITKIHAYIGSNLGTSIQAAVYTENGGAPQSLISQSNAQAQVIGWNDMDIPDTALLGSGTYWLCVNTLNISGTTGLSYFSGSGRFINQAFGSFPVTFANTGTTNSDNFVIYADYCP